MSASLSITETQIFTALRGVLSTFGLASSTTGQQVPIVRGLVNRVPEPRETDFVVMWPTARDRLSMNVDTVADNQFTGTIVINVLTVSAIAPPNVVTPGQPLYGVGVATGCRIIQQLGGTPGGIGTYSVSSTPDVARETLYCGTKAILVPTEVTIQVDVHGPPSGRAADNAHVIEALMRDQFAVDAFIAQGFDVMTLYTSEPRQLLFDNAEDQAEERWSIDCCLQANPIVTVTQQFADQLIATPFEVDLIVESVDLVMELEDGSGVWEFDDGTPVGWG